MRMKDILDYVKHTPENVNPAILKQMIKLYCISGDESEDEDTPVLRKLFGSDDVIEEDSSLFYLIAMLRAMAIKNCSLPDGLSIIGIFDGEQIDNLTLNYNYDEYGFLKIIDNNSNKFIQINDSTKSISLSEGINKCDIYINTNDYLVLFFEEVSPDNSTLVRTANNNSIIFDDPDLNLSNDDYYYLNDTQFKTWPENNTFTITTDSIIGAQINMT